MMEDFEEDNNNSNNNNNDNKIDLQSYIMGKNAEIKKLLIWYIPIHKLCICLVFFF